MSDTVLAGNIFALRRYLGDNQEAFADRVGAKQSYVSKWERGMIPSAVPLARMAELAGCSIEQFMNMEWVPAREASALPTSPALDDGDTVEITQLDLSLSMGPGTLIEDFPEEEPVRMSLAFVRAITRTPSDRLRLVRGIGDSMEPTLRTGDRVMIDINERQLARSHGVYWVDHLGTHGIKRLRAVSRDRVLIMSDNPQVPDFEAAAEDMRILGRAIWFARDL